MNAQILLCVVKTAVMASILALCATSTDPHFDDGLFNLIAFLVGTYTVGTWMLLGVDASEYYMTKQQAQEDYWFSELEDDITNRMQHLTKE